LRAPAFVDLQVNGFAGVDFNHPAVSLEDYRQAVRALWRTGVARFCPTIITGSLDHQGACLRAASAASEDPEIGPSIAALHLEGPYISPEDGPRGAHPRRFVRAPDREEFRRLQDAAQGRIRLLTLAPEWDGALEFIAWLRGQGVVVSLGHTAASPQRIRDAVAAGATMATHLGNGAAEMIHRHHSFLWELLANDGVTASFIADGQHLPPPTLKALLRAKGAGRSVLVTDAVAPACCPPGRFAIGDVPVQLTEEGRVEMADPQQRVTGPDGKLRGRLAGSALRMDAAVGNAVVLGGATLDEALAMAGPQPAAALGLKFSGDAVIFDWQDGRVCVGETIRDGGRLWTSS
jgi:N-acetylglucosamine-6-phosphate deacetylase